MGSSGGQSGTSVATLRGLRGVPSGSDDTIDRNFAITGTALTDGTLIAATFTALDSRTVSKLAVFSGSTVAVTPTLSKMGLYSFDESTLTLLGGTAHDATLLTVGATFYERSMTASVDLVAGSRYAIGFLQVGGTMGSLRTAGVIAGLVGQAPRLALTKAAQADLATVGTLTNGAATIWGRVSV